MGGEAEWIMRRSRMQMEENEREREKGGRRRIKTIESEMSGAGNVSKIGRVCLCDGGQ